MTEPVIFVGMPLHGAYCHHAAARGQMFLPSKRHKCWPFTGVSSLLPGSFNLLLCAALNSRRRYGTTHFAMINGDVCPKTGWVDGLLDAMQAQSADLVSAVVPIKNPHGTTSTAIGDPAADPRAMALRRLTFHELRKLPETFSIADTPWPDKALLVNTGLWLIDIRNAWVKRWLLQRTAGGINSGFHIDSWVEEDAAGELVYGNNPEDWNFSMDLHRMGRKVVATRRPELYHAGETLFPNFGEWGDWQADVIRPEELPEAPEPAPEEEAAREPALA